MHFEFLVEDMSGMKMLNILIPKIIGNEHTYSIHSYKGIGHIPQALSASNNPSKQLLLNKLPKLLRGLGKTFASYPANYPAAIILVCDLDNNCLKKFRMELLDVLSQCNPKPMTRFCIAVEEGEAWLLGDLQTVKSAYPKAKDAVLDLYVNDSICGTWECLAHAVYNGGEAALSGQGWQAVGAEKSQWAEKISPHMDIGNNRSPSFVHFREKLQELAEIAATNHATHP